MSAKEPAATRAAAASDALASLRRQYGCGPVELTGAADALYERHLLFDNVADPAAGPRERYEALARSVRDILSQRWVRTEQTYESVNPKRVYSADSEAWVRKAILTVASSGKFSSDRTIAECAADIWHAKPCPVP